tara:strand:- start:8037 stop:8822 length:786 start_codon:yes stop_codon:yes gene_type:complete
MIVNEEFLKRLRGVFDLNIYEVKIWTALLSLGQATAGELSDVGNVPRSRSYDVLESLEKRGFVVMKLGKPIRYIAVSPEEVLRRVKKNIHEKAEERINTLAKVKNTELFKEIEVLNKTGIENLDPSNLSGVIKSRKGIYNQMESMLKNAKKSVSLVTTSDGFLRKVEYLEKNLKKLKKNNVRVRVATQINNKVKESLNGFRDLEIKNIKDVNARFLVVDGKEVLFMINDDKNIHESNDLGVWIDSPFFAGALDSLFNQSWK